MSSMMLSACIAFSAALVAGIAWFAYACGEAAGRTDGERDGAERGMKLGYSLGHSRGKQDGHVEGYRQAKDEDKPLHGAKGRFVTRKTVAEVVAVVPVDDAG